MMIKNLLGVNSWECIVPMGVRYLSDWRDFDFAEFPGRCIIDKQIPGCGYTEWALRNSYNVILASPRKMLLENKTDQHPGEVFFVKNELDRDPGVDRDISKDSKSAASIVELGFDAPGIYNKVREDFLKYAETRIGMPLKVLVTYDSYYIVKAVLSDLGMFNTFFTVVDEYQSILIDSRFKSSTELEFMEAIRDVQYIHFVSATPMMKEYTDMLDYFKELPVYALNWDKEDPGRVVRPGLRVLLMRSVGSVLPDIVKDYLDGRFERITIQLADGSLKEVISKEAVFYVNSVNHIISMIKKCGLKPEQVNILCAKTSDNQKRLRTKLGKGYLIGSVPLQGQPRKMFTFCTRTVYLGADFYSDNARSFIFSDANSDCLAVDISQDLPQILGRQRLSENPWKNSATFYYRSIADYRKMTEDDFKKIVTEKDKATEDLLQSYIASVEKGINTSALINNYTFVAKVQAYKANYVSVNVKSGIPIPVKNTYVRVSDIRAFKIQQIDYADRFSVFRELESKIVRDDTGVVSERMKAYQELRENISKRIEFLCKLEDSLIQLFLDNLPNSDYAKSYYIRLGKDKCKALGYNVSKIRKVLGIETFDLDDLTKEVQYCFKSGDKVSRANIKVTLQAAYDRLNYKVKAKASHIEKFFEAKAIQIGKERTPGYEIIKPL